MQIKTRYDKVVLGQVLPGGPHTVDELERAYNESSEFLVQADPADMVLNRGGMDALGFDEGTKAMMKSLVNVGLEVHKTKTFAR